MLPECSEHVLDTSWEPASSARSGQLGRPGALAPTSSNGDACGGGAGLPGSTASH